VKNLLFNPPPFSIPVLRLEFYLSHFGVSNSTTDGRCCTRKSHLLTVLRYFSFFQWIGHSVMSTQYMMLDIIFALSVHLLQQDHHIVMSSQNQEQRGTG